MLSIINKYKDENGYIIDLSSLYEELKNNKISEMEIIDILNSIIEENERIKKKLKIENTKLTKIISNKREVNYIEYKKEDETNLSIEQNVQIEEHDISFYINYIEHNLEDDLYLEILPINNDLESIRIIDTILAYYLKEINTIKYFLVIEKDKEYKEILYNDLINYTYIYNTIKEYKEELFYIEETNKEENKNELIFYMNGNESYLYSDIKDNPNSFESIKILLKSIEDGTFKSIKAFNNDDKIKGLFEVRDTRNYTRVIFEPLGRKKYCIIYAITDKRETTQLYKQRLYLRYKKYSEEKNNIKSFNEVDDVKRLLLED